MKYPGNTLYRGIVKDSKEACYVCGLVDNQYFLFLSLSCTLYIDMLYSCFYLISFFVLKKERVVIYVRDA